MMTSSWHQQNILMHSHSWSLVVTRGHSWSLVVTRGHSRSLVCTFRRDRIWTNKYTNKDRNWQRARWPRNEHAYSKYISACELIDKRHKSAETVSWPQLSDTSPPKNNENISEHSFFLGKPEKQRNPGFIGFSWKSPESQETLGFSDRFFYLLDRIYTVS